MKQTTHSKFKIQNSINIPHFEKVDKTLRAEMFLLFTFGIFYLLSICTFRIQNNFFFEFE